MMLNPLSGSQYDRQWKELGDFIVYNPGARHRRRLCLQLVKDLHIDSVADIGCGPGELLLALRETHPEIGRFVGADLASETMDATAHRLPWAELCELDVTKDALDQTFSLVTCAEVIEHLSEQRQAMKNLAKMVAPGGHLLISCPTGKMFTTEKHFGHVRHPTPADLTSWGDELGLETVRKTQWGFPTYLALKHLVNLFPDLSMKEFGSGDYNAPKRFINNALYWATFASLPDSQKACQLFWLYRKPRERA